MSREIVFRALFPFGGLGAGARGFLDAHSHLFDFDLRFECLGGIDLDAEACSDFEYLTGAPSWCVDMLDVTPAQLVARYGVASPDCVFLSPPCKGASGLTPAELAATEKYQRMNELALVWMRAMLGAWGDDPPKLVLLENVPRLKTRARKMLDECKRMLRRAGYRLHEGYHCCGEIGGLAQRRRRYLLVARLEKRCPNLLHQPPKKRVRACGEVLGELPVPATPEALELGRLHDLPRISWTNWCRLALIPPGGDWRDIDGVLAEGQARRELFKRHEVNDWGEPTGVVTGSGSNAVSYVGDPRSERFGHVERVSSWEDPVGTITRSPAPSSGAPSVADPRWFGDVYGVRSWDDPSGAITARATPSTGVFSVADPRWFHGVLGVMPWDAPSRAVIGGRSNGAVNVADPRLPADARRHWNKYAVGSWDDAARTVISKSQPGSGGPAVADPRVRKAYPAGYAVLDWTHAARTVAATTSVGCGAYAVGEPRTILAFNVELDAALARADLVPGKPPPFLPVIRSRDGTWHRPLTTLELASLQGIPHRWRGAPLRLAGPSQSRWRERIGNAVPVGAARAIAERMLVTLGASALGSYSMDAGAVWVTPSGEEHGGMMLAEVSA